MALKNTYNNVEDIPEAAVSLYTQVEDGESYKLNTEIEGLVDKSRLDEFRDNNIQLRKDIESQHDVVRDAGRETEEIRAQMKALETKFSSIDLEEWNTLQAEKKAMVDKELIEAGEVDTLINRRVEEVLAAKQREIDAIKSDYEEKIGGLNDNLTNYDTQLSKMLVDNEITKIAADAGVRSSAMEDVMLRGRGMFRVENGEAVAYDQEGRAIYGDDAVTPLSMKEWIGSLTENAPHLFEASTGAAVQQPTSTPITNNSEVTGLESILAGLSGLK